MADKPIKKSTFADLAKQAVKEFVGGAFSKGDSPIGNAAADIQDVRSNRNPTGEDYHNRQHSDRMNP